MRASGRGESGWAYERAVFPNAGAQDGKKSSGLGCGFCVFAGYLHRFQAFFKGLVAIYMVFQFFRFLLVVYIVFFSWFWGFLMVIVAIHMGSEFFHRNRCYLCFFVFCVFAMYLHGF